MKSPEDYKYEYLRCRLRYDPFALLYQCTKRYNYNLMGAEKEVKHI